MARSKKKPAAATGKSAFNDREGVARALNLPNVTKVVAIGPTDDVYRDALEAVIVRLVGANGIRKRETRASNEGKYTSYRFHVRIKNIAQLDDLYRQIGALEGTRSVM